MSNLDQQQASVDLLMQERIQETTPNKGIINKYVDYSFLGKDIPAINRSAQDDGWTEEKQKKAALLSLHLVDWAQTRDLVRKTKEPGSTWHEQNFLLGRKPHQDKVDAYFALTGLAEQFLIDELPDKLKQPLLDSLIKLEIGAVGNNFNLGIKAKF